MKGRKGVGGRGGGEVEEEGGWRSRRGRERGNWVGKSNPIDFRLPSVVNPFANLALTVLASDL